jgi:hypothetical protein
MGRARDIANVLTTVQNIDVSSSLDSRIYINSASPSTPQNGQIWIDTSTASAPVLSISGNSTWRTPTFGRFMATGGTENTSDAYKYHTFTGSGSFVISSGMKNIEYLVVSGGGGGGAHAGGGGGGAGGLLTGTFTNLGIGTYAVTIGAGGGRGTTVSSENAQNGNPSIFNSVSPNGGGKGAYATSGFSGGSGGGGTGGNAGGAGTINQGFSGGSGANGSGGGGGGAGGVGLNNIGNNPGNGGPGALIFGSYYGGGGGGGRHPDAGNGGTGGVGGGGAGAPYGTVDATSGTTNSGGGGGGAGGRSGINPSQGGNGGSGIVILRYLT